DSAAANSLRCRQQPEAPGRIAEGFGLPVRYIHVYRNPFDNIAAISRAGKLSMKEASASYFAMAEGVQAVRKHGGDAVVFDLCLEEFVRNPQPQLRELCRFLELDCDDDYLRDCSN